MSYFFVSVLQAFLPVALLLGLNWVVRPAPALNRIVWITILMVVVGMWAGTHYPKSQQLQLVLAGGANPLINIIFIQSAYSEPCIRLLLAGFAGIRGCI